MGEGVSRDVSEFVILVMKKRKAERIF